MSEENKENKTPEVSAEEQEDVKSEQTQENQPGAEVTSEATEPQVEAEKKEDTSETPEAEKQPEESQKEEKPVVAETEVAKEETTEPVAEGETVETPEPQAEPAKAEAEKPEEEEVSLPAETAELPSFDWDSIGKKQETYTDSERQKLEDLYDNTMKSITDHEVLDGTVVSMNQREVVVNIGYKSDGIIPFNEIRYNPELKPGDKIEVYVENQEDSTGQLLLSHKKARILRSWERINEAYEKDEILNGYVKSRTKGGLIVDLFGIEAFLPGSQIDVKPIRDYDIFVDKTMEFKVVKINHEYKNVVVSHKALIEDELEAQKAEIMAKLEKGQVLEGTVKNITSYGVFIDLGGVDGLIHITDLSWGRINHPEEVVELDQKIKVVILDFDDNKKRIALGLKQLTPHPWEALDTDLKVGDKVKGKVVVIADYGAFIEIAPGVEGLIHVSEMSWSQHLRTAQDFLNVGDEVEAVILTLDREERKMSLGIKQLIPDPWINIKERYPVNSKHKAIVRNFTNFGIFVELEEGVDGLIHISDLSWSKKIKHPAEFTKIGEEIEVVVLDVDEENRRLSLGHKQLEENPWDVFESVFTVGSVHKGTVIEVNDKGAVVALPYGVEGFTPKRHMGKEEGGQIKLDDSVDFKVIEFSKDNKKIILSHSRIHQDQETDQKNRQEARAKKDERTTRRAVTKIKDNIEKTTLGDIEALASLKSDMEQEAREKLEKMAKRKQDAEKKKEEEKEEESATEEPQEDVTEEVEAKQDEEKKAEMADENQADEAPENDDAEEKEDNEEKEDK
ncbi:MAG: 30S ribosomal protein S1 [Bacteroidales bacterium]|nr:30S ribosomal protein S1 [Bacteroidales bacterium]